MVYPHFEICFNIDLQLANKRTLTCNLNQTKITRLEYFYVCVNI